MHDDDPGLDLSPLISQFFNPSVASGSSATPGFIHQDDIRAHGHRPYDAESLRLAAREAGPCKPDQEIWLYIGIEIPDTHLKRVFEAFTVQTGLAQEPWGVRSWGWPSSDIGATR